MPSVQAIAFTSRDDKDGGIVPRRFDLILHDESVLDPQSPLPPNVAMKISLWHGDAVSRFHSILPAMAHIGPTKPKQSPRFGSGDNPDVPRVAARVV